MRTRRGISMESFSWTFRRSRLVVGLRQRSAKGRKVGTVRRPHDNLKDIVWHKQRWVKEVTRISYNDVKRLLSGTRRWKFSGQSDSLLLTHHFQATYDTGFFFKITSFRWSTLRLSSMSTENDLSDKSRIQQKRVISRGWWTAE